MRECKLKIRQSQPLRLSQMLSFQYKSQIKKVAQMCAYCNKPFKNTPQKLRASAEHILPHSKGGADNIHNYLAVHVGENSARGNQNFDAFVKSHPEVVGNIKKYLHSLEGQTVDGINYVPAVKKTLNEQMHRKVFFA